jgi:hypothetical protein
MVIWVPAGTASVAQMTMKNVFRSWQRIWLGEQLISALGVRRQDKHTYDLSWIHPETP